MHVSVRGVVSNVTYPRRDLGIGTSSVTGTGNYRWGLEIFMLLETVFLNSTIP